MLCASIREIRTVNDSAIFALCVTAASIGFIHTIIGPDHYLPFIVMSKARNWGLKRTMGLTLICGIGHVLSSVVLGLIGVSLGVALGKLTAFESLRGGFAAQAMMVFGFSYCVWGIWAAIKNKPHTHTHRHNGHEDEHVHEHVHTHAHAHLHEKVTRKRSLTPWVLFVVFVLGPCEPLIPMMMLAAPHSFVGTALVAIAFSVVTLATMSGVVLLSYYGFSFVKLGKAERYAHAMAGGTILLSGLAVQLLGL